MNDAPLSFGQWLKRYRTLLGFSQEEFAEQLNYATVTYRKVEHGMRPSRAFVERLAEFLQLPASDSAVFSEFALTGTLQQPLNLPQPLNLSQPFAVIQPPAEELPPVLDTLPISPTRLIGRERDMQTLIERMRYPDIRLITLVGPPGVGKTRLAQEVARSLRAEFGDGVFFVPLAPLRDPNDVISTIGELFQVSNNSQQTPLQQLITQLQQQQLLLVLDNFEHVLAAAVEIAELLAWCPKIKVIVTSRVALHIRSEWIFSVMPLALPNLSTELELEEIERAPAVALFVERAKAISPDFRLTAENMSNVAAICSRLDGLPLTIELAAVHVRYMAPGALLERLTIRLEMLISGARDLPLRQQTLRSAIAWSYELLYPHERTLFARLSVFAEICSLEAIETVCSDDLAGCSNVLATVMALVDKSLLWSSKDSNSSPRFGMLETIREYAWEQLVQQGEAELLQERHARYYLQFAEMLDANLRSPQMVGCLKQLEAQHNNIRAALRWCEAHPHATDLGVRLVAALGQFWYGRGHLTEGWRWLQTMLNKPGDASVAARAKALFCAGMISNIRGDCALVITLIEQSLQLRLQINDSKGITECQALIAMIAVRQGDYARATTLLVESLQTAELYNDPWLIGLINIIQAQLDLALGSFEQASTCLDQALILFRQLSEPFCISWIFSLQGNIAWYQGDYDRAEHLQQESLHLRQKIGVKSDATVSLQHIARIALDKGDIERSKLYFMECLKQWQIFDSRTHTMHCLEGLAEIAAIEQDGLRAARLWGAARALGQTIDISQAPVDSRYRARAVTRIQSQLSNGSWQIATQEGATLTLEQAIQYALSEVDYPQTVTPGTEVIEQDAPLIAVLARGNQRR